MKPFALGIAALAAFSVSAPSTATDVTYRKDIRPLMEQKCLGCHGSGAPYYGDFKEDVKKYEAAMKGRGWIPMPIRFTSSAGRTRAH